jgi:hypothetical protein
MVLPAFGGATSRPRWPLPIGATRSMMRPVRSSVLPLPFSRVRRSSGNSGRQVLEQDLALGVLGLVEVDLADLEQGEVTLAVLWRANLARDRVPGAQVEAADLARRDVDVVGAGEVGAVRRAQEAEAVLQDLQDAVAVDVLTALRVALQDREDDVLLARAGHVLEADTAGDIDEFLRGLGLEVGEVHRCASARIIRVFPARIAIPPAGSAPRRTSPAAIALRALSLRFSAGRCSLAAIAAIAAVGTVRGAGAGRLCHRVADVGCRGRALFGAAVRGAVRGVAVGLVFSVCCGGLGDILLHGVALYPAFGQRGPCSRGASALARRSGCCGRLPGGITGHIAG